MEFLMPSLGEWRVPPDVEPRPENYDYDLREALDSVVAIKATIPEDAFTADILGTERSGNGVVIRDDGIVLTIGYLVTEAETIWMTTNDDRVIQGHVLGYDHETGFGLVQALGRLDLPTLSLGRAADAKIGARVVAAGAGGAEHSVAAFVAARQEFAGYWEYVLDEAIFTVPAHPYWGGTALVGPAGDLIGIGSLQLQQAREDGTGGPLNMFVPIDLLGPILDDMLTIGRPNHPPRPWLGLYAADSDDGIVIAGIAGRGPAARADIRAGDVVLSVGDRKVDALAGFFRAIWSQGKAGVEVPMKLLRKGRVLDINVKSGDRYSFLKGPSLQ
jgi:S1-C subfamily serine protease